MKKDDTTIKRPHEIQDGVNGWKLIKTQLDFAVWQQPQGWFMYRIHGGQTYHIGRPEQELNDWLSKHVVLSLSDGTHPN